MKILERLTIGLCFTGMALACAAQPAQDSGDSIRLTFLGTGAPRPSRDRYGPSILVEAGRHKILVDAGPGMRERLFEAGGFDLITTVDHILVTHLHFDHTISIPGMWLSGWLYGRKVPMHVYGPQGTEEMMRHFTAAYDWDIRYRKIVGVHSQGAELLAQDVGPGVVFDRDGMKVTAFEVEHMPIDVETGELLGLDGQTIGFRIDYAGRSVLFSGDTRTTGESAINDVGQDVDVLIHEVQVPAEGDSPEAKLANVSLSVHSTPQQVAEVFSRTKPRLGVYSHIIPPDISAEELLAKTRPGYSGSMVVAHDLMTITIGDEIEFGTAKNEGTEVFEESDVVQ